MSTLTSFSVIPANVDIYLDIQTVFNRIGCDMIMFVSAVLAYWVLHRARTKAMPAKTFHKESPTLEKVTPKQVDHAVADIKLPAPASAIEAKSSPDKCHSARPQLDQKPSQIKCEPKQPKQSPPHQEPFSVTKHLTLMQKYAAVGNIKETLHNFRMIQFSGENLTSTMYNTVLRAWIKCGNVWAAENLMEEIKQAGLADESTFVILMKALVRVSDLGKAYALLRSMRDAGVSPGIAIFNELLRGLARGGHFDDGLPLLKEMEAAGAQPTSFTFSIITKLVNSGRHIYQRWEDVRGSLAKYEQSLEIAPSRFPCLASVISRVAGASSCVHTVEMKGSWARIKALRKTLKQHGFMDKAESDGWPLDGHWETFDGHSIVIEGKIVRQSRECAYRLSFTSADRRECMLRFRGKSTRGHMTTPYVSGATKALRWDNGDIWHSFDGRNMTMVTSDTPSMASFDGHSTFMSQSMTKISRDKAQDVTYRDHACAVLKCVCKQGLYLPMTLEDNVMEYLGNDLYYFQVHFMSKTTHADIFFDMSRRHPRVGFRHCWAKPGNGSCGQKTLVNGDETDEACFNRHIGAVCIG